MRINPEDVRIALGFLETEMLRALVRKIMQSRRERGLPPEPTEAELKNANSTNNSRNKLDHTKPF
jgi:hypothetical protein